MHKLLHTAKKPSRPKVTACGVKQSECKVCEDILLIKLLLTAHKYIHSGEKPNECTACDKAMEMRTYQTIHKLLHTGEKP